MTRRIVSLGAALLLVTGFIAGYLVNIATANHGGNQAAASSSSASPSIQSFSSTGSSIDAATQDAYAVASKSVVFVDNPGNGTGSGVIYDGQGDIVTNDHVVSGGKTFKVTFYNGRTARATLLGTDGADDLAVIHVDASGLHPATFAAKGSYRIAETVLAIGSPLGLQDSVTSGLISGLHRTEQEPNGAYIPNAIQTSAPINPGNSGGALVALNGDVVGIPTMVQTTTGGNETVQNVGFAIPAGRVTFIAGQIIQYGRVTHTDRAFLGVSVGDVSRQSGGGFFFGPGGFGQGGTGSNVAGAVVNTVKATGPAGRAGLRAGDVITRFDGKTITSSDDLLRSLAHLKPGQTVSVTFNRNGTNHTVQVALGELPA